MLHRTYGRWRIRRETSENKHTAAIAGTVQAEGVITLHNPRTSVPGLARELIIGAVSAGHTLSIVRQFLRSQSGYYGPLGVLMTLNSRRAASPLVRLVEV
ncbi:hypothetical protein TNCV_2976351 [Trichonephila clavipes]|nr:hypothetical protein TNCV_2976351 [Trichonephila clavipes]